MQVLGIVVRLLCPEADNRHRIYDDSGNPSETDTPAAAAVAAEIV